MLCVGLMRTKLDVGAVSRRERVAAHRSSATRLVRACTSWDDGLVVTRFEKSSSLLLRRWRWHMRRLSILRGTPRAQEM